MVISDELDFNSLQRCLTTGYAYASLISQVRSHGLTSPPTPLRDGEGSRISPPSLVGKGAGRLGLCAKCEGAIALIK
ncbi:MAG: hypothetical protein ACYT04_38575 [Nostoc sp.]